MKLFQSRAPLVVPLFGGTLRGGGDKEGYNFLKRFLY